jgi:hypothetical protein
MEILEMIYYIPSQTFNTIIKTQFISNNDITNCNVALFDKIKLIYPDFEQLFHILENLPSTLKVIFDNENKPNTG